MKNLLLSLVLGTAALTAPCAAQNAPAAAGEMTAEQIVSTVHRSRALNDIELNGELTTGKTVVPFTVQLVNSLVQFKFEGPRQHIKLDITEKGYRLKEVTAGSNREVPHAMYASGVRGTDMSYDDLSMRYLFWPKKVKIGEETIRTQRCYVVDLYNPQRLGEYYMVRIFVHKESGGLMRLNCFDWEGKKMKEYIVIEGMKVNGKTMLETMDVYRYTPGTRKVVGKTTFRLKKPKG